MQQLLLMHPLAEECACSQSVEVTGEKEKCASREPWLPARQVDHGDCTHNETFWQTAAGGLISQNLFWKDKPLKSPVLDKLDPLDLYLCHTDPNELVARPRTHTPPALVNAIPCDPVWIFKAQVPHTTPPPESFLGLPDWEWCLPVLTTRVPLRCLFYFALLLLFYHILMIIVKDTSNNN